MANPMPGDMREAAEWHICGADLCEAVATSDVFITTADGQAVWLSLCEDHVAAARRGEALEYVIELHGFVPAVAATEEDE